MEPRYRKVVDARYLIPQTQGGGLVKIEFWQNDQGEVVKYSLAYIHPALYPHDNGRVIGYDNAHNYHHRHELGQITPVTDFISYTDQLRRFETELKRYIQWP